MKNILKSSSGNIAIAMLLTVIGLMSGLSISSMGLRDTIAAQAELESIQGLHLLRAEATRGQSFLEKAAKTDPALSGGLRTPLRSIEITGSHYAKTYTMQSNISLISQESDATVIDVGGETLTGSTGAGEIEYAVRSLVETKSGIGQVAYFSTNKSMVRKYSEMTIVQDTGPVFMYFTDNELSPNDENVYFYGYDVFQGPVHTNSDIQIKQAGGDPASSEYNQGWPKFKSLVTTTGTVISNPAQYPRDLVFQGGLIEEYDHYEYPSSMTELRNNGRPVGPTTPSADRIVIVTVNNTYYEGFIGEIEAPRRAYADVWPNYPFGTDVDPLYRNNFNVRDTTWVTLPSGSCANRSQYVLSKLWIKGTFSGFQTWGATDTLSMIGDILLSGTVEGHSPVTNRLDMVGLISEESIMVKYGYWDPADTVRYHTNMGMDSEFADPAGGGIWIYAAMAALGRGVGDRYKDGVFTFEYQHPHGSIPAQLINVPNVGPTLFDWIDLHRNKWYQTATQPWPPWLDFPWYNPLWPERNPYLERGTINIWGGVNQRRRGYVHRNFYDNEYPSGGIWNPPIDFCGATSAPNPTQIQLYANPNVFVTLQTRHYTGASGSGVGYKKNYNYDTRMYKKKPPNWPYFKKQGERLPMEQGNWLLKRPPRALL